MAKNERRESTFNQKAPASSAGDAPLLTSHGSGPSHAHDPSEDQLRGLKRLTGLRVAIIAADDFEETELTDPKQALEDAGATTTLIAPHEGELQAMRHDEKTRKVKDASGKETKPITYGTLELS